MTKGRHKTYSSFQINIFGLKIVSNTLTYGGHFCLYFETEQVL